MKYAAVIYIDTTSKEAVADFMEKQKRQQERKRRRQQRRCFIKQRLMGISLIVFTMLAVEALDGDVTVALITVPLGIALIFSRKKLSE